MSWRTAIGANLLVFAFIGFFAWLQSAHPIAYYDAMQEDRALEWASFWSFFIAGFVFAVAAWRQHRSTRALPWFLSGLALFCVVVAMEEISWGQRVFGLQPAEFFLAENYQQEINFHNVASTDQRLFVFRAIIVSYGVLLPLLAAVPVMHRVFERLRVVSPPLALAPSMLLLFGVHLEYPWKFTGELVECGVGFVFLFAAVTAVSTFASKLDRNGGLGFVTSPALAIALSLMTAAWSQNRGMADPEKLAKARAETVALRKDFVALAKKRKRSSVTRCGLHKRLYTFVTDRNYHWPLRDGEFAGLVEQGMSETRAEFFLDPWSSPYWIRDRCNKKTGERVVFIYSFGPNRSRDSNRWEILGDDIGDYVLRRLER